jgi:hypothetical protein
MVLVLIFVIVKSSRRILQYCFFGLLISFFGVITILAREKTLYETFRQLIVTPFVYSRQVMGAKSDDWMTWESWFKNIALSMSFSLLPFCLLLVLVYLIHLKVQNLGKYLVPPLGIAFFCILFFGSKIALPSDLNGNPLLWFVKVLQSMGTYLVWPLGLSFIWMLLRPRVLKKLLSIRSLEQGVFVFSLGLLNLSLLPNMYMNFGYIYWFIPTILLSAIVLSNILTVPIASAKVIAPLLLVLRTSTVGLFLLLAFAAFQSQSSFESKAFQYMSRSSTYGTDFDRFLKIGALAIADTSASLVYCPYTIFRSTNPQSFEFDFEFFDNPPETIADFKKRLNPKVRVVLICNATPEDLTVFQRSFGSQWILEEEVSLKRPFSLAWMSRV